MTFLRKQRGLLLLLVGVAALHLVLRSTLPAPTLFGDERNYLPLALMDDAQDRSSLLPGTLRFEHRPQLTSRVFSLVTGGVEGDPTRSDEAAASVVVEVMETDQGKLFRRIEALQIGLALLAVCLAYLLARTLALTERASLWSASILGLFPPLAFHAHALWPELLHTCLSLLLVLGLVSAAKAEGKARAFGILLAGLSGGYCLLAKGTLVSILPVLACLLAWSDWRRAQRLTSLLPAGAFLGLVALVVLPQMRANESTGNGFALSANRWWNLELGLRDLGEPDPVRLEAALAEGMHPGLQRWLPAQRASRAYLSASTDPQERERLAKERTLAEIDERGLGSVLLAQFPKYVRLLTLPEFTLLQAATYQERWGSVDRDQPTLAALLIWFTRCTWWALLLTAGAGALRLLRLLLRGEVVWHEGWPLVLVLVLYLFVAVFLVPVKARFLLPAAPFLALLAARAFDRNEEARRA